MKPLARVAIPESTSADLLGAIKEHLSKSYPPITIKYGLKAAINQLMALSFDRNGAELGSVEGDKDAFSVAMIGGIHIEANRAFRRE